MSSAVASIHYRFGRFELLPEESQLLADGASVRIGPHACDVLLALVERAGHLVTKDELLERVWGKVVVEENTLQAHISALRKVLGASTITTVSGRGYRFTLEVNPVGAALASSASAPKNNLPLPLTSFIGRERAMTELGQLLGSTRLITLTGSGGAARPAWRSSSRGSEQIPTTRALGWWSLPRWHIRRCCRRRLHASSASRKRPGER